ncbi:MAG TPA: MarR family transcriptional regulator [Stenomitos sp.]
MTIELNAVSDHLLHVYRLIRRTVYDLAQSRGMTASQLMALRYVALTPDCSMNELTRHLNVTRAAVTSIVDRLEREGLVRRQAGSDRRIFHLRLTPEGEAAILSMRQALHGEIQRWIGTLSPEKAEALAVGLEALSGIALEGGPFRG